MLTPEGIKPGRNKLQAIRDAQPPKNIKMVRSFVGLCNFSERILKILPFLPLPFSKSQGRTLGTSPALYLLMHFMLSKFFSSN
jgi:hypothetical protein